MSSPALDIIDKYFTCEFTTLSRSGAPQTWPVSPRLLADGRLLVTTSIGLPQKAFNIRRNPKVSMLFSEPTGSGITQHAALLIQGDSIAEDRIVTDVSSDPDLAALMETVAKRQPAGTFWSSALGRRMWWSYYMRILIYVLHCLPPKDWTESGFMGFGMIYTALPVTNAVPAVVAAAPGIVTLKDLPPVTGRFAISA